MKHDTQFSFLHNFCSNKAFLKTAKHVYRTFLSSDLYICPNVMCNAYPVNNHNPENKIFPSCSECQKLKEYDSVILSFISSRISCYSHTQLIKLYQTRNRVFYLMWNSPRSSSILPHVKEEYQSNFRKILSVVTRLRFSKLLYGFHFRCFFCSRVINKLENIACR